MNRRVIGLAVVGAALLMLLSLLAVPMMIVGGTSMLFASNGGSGCPASGSSTVQQPQVSQAGKSIPANYLFWYKKVGQQYGVPWTILAGIGTEESENGQSTLPGVHSGTNSAGAAGPMQLGVGGAAGDQWASVATSEDGKSPASVYDPADAIAGAAKYLIQHGVQSDVQSAIFAYNHADWYVQAVLNYASEYAAGGFTVSATNLDSSTTCTDSTMLSSMTSPNAAVTTAIDFAEQQLGKPYQLSGTGPDSFDCSGLVMMAYRAAGIIIPRTSQEQWNQGYTQNTTMPHVPASQVQPGDLVFFVGSDGTPASPGHPVQPGHVGLVIGHGEMIEAYATGFPIRISSYGKPTSPPGDQTVVGFARPWSKTG